MIISTINTKPADCKSDHTDQYRPECHIGRISKHLCEFCTDFLCTVSDKITTYAAEAVIHHPSAYTRIKHHQQIASQNADPFGNMPSCSFRLQFFKCCGDTEMTAAADGELADHNRHSHDQQEYQINQNKCCSSHLSTQVWKLPYIANTDRTSCRYKNESQTRSEFFSFHILPSLFLYMLRCQDQKPKTTKYGTIRIASFNPNIMLNGLY